MSGAMAPMSSHGGLFPRSVLTVDNKRKGGRGGQVAVCGTMCGSVCVRHSVTLIKTDVCAFASAWSSGGAKCR